MIVRIATEGQFRVGSAALDRLNEIDNTLMAAVAADDGAGFSRLLGELLAVVRGKGQPVATAEIVESDIILPPPDTSLAEARHLFQVDGLIPG